MRYVSTTPLRLSFVPQMDVFSGSFRVHFTTQTLLRLVLATSGWECDPSKDKQDKRSLVPNWILSTRMLCKVQYSLIAVAPI